MNEHERALFERLVMELAARASRKRLRIVANWEVDDSAEDGFVHDLCIFTVERNVFGRLGIRDDLDVTVEDYDIVREVQRSMAARGSAWWTMDLEIDAGGDYCVDFDYNPPRRLNGVLDDRSTGRFDRYLEPYQS